MTPTLPSNEQDLHARDRRCRALAQKYALVSGASSAVPLPGVDVAIDLFNMKNCLEAINREYGLTPDQIDALDEQQKIVLQSVMSGAANAAIGKVITHDLLVKLLQKLGVRMASRQVAKFVPVLGGALSAGIGYASFITVCNQHIKQCQDVVRRSWAATPPPPETPPAPLS